MFLGAPARAFFVVTTAAACLSPLSASAAPPPSGTPLTLASGWSTNPGSAAPAVMSYHGIVHLIGAMKGTGSAGEQPFTLPPAFFPPFQMVVKVDMCNGANGLLVLQTDGTVDLQAENSFSDAQCFTSLDGATYASTKDGYRLLRLRHGWQSLSPGTDDPAARAIGGVVHFEGWMAGGTRPLAFVLPAALRPAATVYLPLDGGLFEVVNGVAIITPDGKATIQGEGGDLGDMEGLTALDGPFFALDATGFTPLTLVNGWTNSTRGTAAPAARVEHGIVEFQGGMSSAGSNPTAFVLPAGMRPAHHVDVPVNMCNANNGRLDIDTSGNVLVQAQTQSNATCFTSLEGASFHL